MSTSGILFRHHIDPHVIYIAALIRQVESKISQIDFVNANLDELMQEWSDKPETQVPTYIRQLLRLKQNAEKFGYQRSGNSWTLKG